MTDPVVATYSIVACDLEAGQWGVATQSKYLAVGSVVPWAEPLVGAVATQAWVNPRFGPDGLALLRDGLAADQVVARLTDADPGRAHRQLGVVDAAGRAASYTGERCMKWAGGRTGDGYAAQGNILVSGETVDAIAETFEATAGTAAHASPARRTRRRPGRGRRQPRPAVRRAPGRRRRTAATEAVRHARRPPCRRPRGPAERAPAPARPPRRALRQDAPRHMDQRSTTSWRPSSGSDWRPSATTATWPRRSPHGPGRRTWRSALTVSSSIDPVVLEALREAR